MSELKPVPGFAFPPASVIEAIEAHRATPSLPSGSVEPMTETPLDQMRRLAIGGDRLMAESYIGILENEIARLRSGGDEAGRRLREAAEKARSLLNMAVYIADKNGRQDCVIAVSLVSEVETALRASLSSSGTTETSRARAEAC